MNYYYYHSRAIVVNGQTGKLCKRLTLLMCLWVLGSWTFTYAQGEIKGKLQKENSDPVVGAAVMIEGTRTGTLTNKDGEFSLSVKQNPPLNLIITYFGMDSVTQTVTDFAQPVNVVMTEKRVELAAVDIIANAAEERKKRSPVTVESMGINAIKETPAANFYDGLGNLKGVDLTAASLGFKIVNTRGFNSTAPVRSLQLIDGVDNQSPGLNFSLGNFLGASDLDVESVDLIVGASSAYYGPNAFNGVISMKTKNPFVHRGLSASVKVGERNLAEGAIRYAKVFQDKNGKDRFAFKINVFYMQADDWEANNMDESYRDTSDSRAVPYVGIDNPGGYDAVNRYGDENLNPAQNRATNPDDRIKTPGLGRWHRTGYLERDLVDYDTRNFKGNLAFHYKLNNDAEVIASTSYSNGTTVFQGDNRISLKDIQFFQHRLEIQKRDKYFLRAYMTHEDAGNSYDAVFTAFKLQENRKSDSDWSQEYRTTYVELGYPAQVRAIEGFPSVPRTPPFIYDFATADSIVAANNGLIGTFHDDVRSVVDNNYLVPGTAAFDSVFNDIISKPFTEGGTRFVDRSALYHLHGEYKFTPAFGKITLGSNARLYAPNTEGTIFLDTAERIINFEYGVYAGLEKQMANDELRLNATLRMDKNQNFNYLFSPAVSLVWTPDESQVFRISFGGAIRNPTLSNQFLFYNVGRAILLGNLDGRDSLLTAESLEAYSNTFNGDTLEYFNVDPIRPERVQTIELGYRVSLNDKIYFDANYYYSRYQDFIGFEIGLDVGFTTGIPTAVQAFRIASNAQDVVTTQGVAVGLDYFLTDEITLNGNYSWNRLNTATDDPIIPAFNTPEHKFNLGITGRNVRIRNTEGWGFSANYKWVQGFLFEGSPQFTGFIEDYGLVDAQVSKYVDEIKGTFKLGSANILNNRVYQAYGGPLIGRLSYFSVTFDVAPK
ncbi:MAG: TonB-dependent receptor [Bacteroidota bacterium]